MAPVLTLAEAPDHPHNQARGAYVEVAGVPVAGPVPRFSGTPAAVAGPPPALGADTEQVLTELGYSADRLAELRPPASSASADRCRRGSSGSQPGLAVRLEHRQDVAGRVLEPGDRGPPSRKTPCSSTPS